MAAQDDFWPSDEGARRRDAGAEQAKNHADQVAPDWSETALLVLRDYAATHDEFRIEQVRQHAETVWKLESPPDKRAWGAIAMSAARAGWLRKVGFAVQTDPKSHHGFCALWRMAR